jgi:hypothetical protein
VPARGAVTGRRAAALLATMTALGCSGTDRAPAPAADPATAPAADPAPAPTVPASKEDAAVTPPREPIRLALGETRELHDLERLELLDFEIEEIAAAPEDPEAYPAGFGVTVRLSVAGETVTLTRLSAGYDSALVAWTGSYRIELVEVSDGQPVKVGLHIDRIGEQPISGSVTRVRVERGGTVALGDDLALRFLGHGHKRVMTGGPPSPLMVDVEYRAGDRRLEEVTHYLHLELDDGRSWRWRDRRVELIEHGYDRFMVLEVARLPLLPLP